MSARPSAPRRLEAVIILSRSASLQCGMAEALELSLFGAFTWDKIRGRCESWLERMSCRMFTACTANQRTKCEVMANHRQAWYPSRYLWKRTEWHRHVENNGVGDRCWGFGLKKCRTFSSNFRYTSCAKLMPASYLKLELNFSYYILKGT